MAIINNLFDSYGRHALARLLGALSPWPPLADSLPGYSIMLGLPWDLRHLLPVNERFVERCDLNNLVDLHVIFDRRHPYEMDDIGSNELSYLRNQGSTASSNQCQ